MPGYLVSVHATTVQVKAPTEVLKHGFIGSSKLYHTGVACSDRFKSSFHLESTCSSPLTTSTVRYVSLRVGSVCVALKSHARLNA